MQELVKRRFDVKFLCIEKTNWPDQGIDVIQVKSMGANSIEKIGYDFTDAALKGAVELKRNNYKPDVIVAHYGWGLWRIKGIFQKAKLIIYCEWMFNESNRKYHHWGKEKELEFEAEVIDELTKDAFQTAILKSDIAICPTRWQKNTFSKNIRQTIEVLEDGFPSDLFYPKKSQISKTKQLQLVYVSRGMEYTRGIDRLLEIVKRVRDEGCEDNIEFKIICDEKYVYDDRKKWELYSGDTITSLKEYKNVKIVNQLPYNKYVEVLRESDIHLYLSREFVLSWSFIESSLLGSYILSVNNNSTIEVTHANHINHKTTFDLANTLVQYAKSTDLLQQLRKSKLNWTRTEEYQLYKQRFSIQKQINQYIQLFLA